jgi:hypothetical protein
LVLGIGLLALAAARADDTPQDRAAAAITEAGGKIDRDEKAPDKPITAVSFATLPVEDATLACLDGLGSVQKLTLNVTKITDAGLDHVQGLGALKKLYLVDTKITDAGLAKLKGLSNLEILSLVGTEVTDAGLEHLKGMASLQTVFLAGTKVTDEGVKSLQEALPKLKIER